MKAGRFHGFAWDRLGCLALALALLGLAAAPALGQLESDLGKAGVRSFDVRRGQGLTALQATPDQAAALEALHDTVGEGFVARIDDLTGATGSLWNMDGTLTGANSGSPEEVARSFVTSNHAALGLTPEDLTNMVKTDEVYSRVSDTRHLYFRQVAADGLEVWGGVLSVHLRSDGGVISVTSGFVGGLDQKLAALDASPGLDPLRTLESIARRLNLPFKAAPSQVSRGRDAARTTVLTQPEIASEPVRVTDVIVPLAGGSVTYGHRVLLNTSDGDHMYDLVVTRGPGGEPLALAGVDSVANDSYNVFAQPCESPNLCGRSIVSNPADPTASPQGWFPGTIMDGNNVHAYHDQDANNQPPASQPSCGTSQNCDFPLNLSQAPGTYVNAAVANLFYWNNVIHDIHYQYGFDEQAGNFQENNFGRGGAGSDSVNAEAQDGSGTNNANFSTPTDGGNPRMQMFIWTAANPDRDSDLDSGIITHEYGHGISIRQIGGPNTNCFGGQQQFGEGHSDLVALVYTAQSSHTGATARGVGGYAANSGGIRPQPYSTNTSVNDATYQTLTTGVSVPHGVGWVWASILWEAYWELVDIHGFSPSLLTPSSAAGNERFLFYMNEGLKFTDCSGNTVNFVDGRDGILQAASQMFSGEDVCPLWRAFARRGLGVNALATNSNSQAQNSFDVPSSCQAPPPPGDCLHVADFGTAEGWTQGNDTCTTGSFVVGSPTQVVNGGVTTQPAGGADGTTNAFFTAPNSAAGTDDVDGGTCEALSPVINASGLDAVEISLSYFHGQRDAGDDSTDGFTIEVLNNGQVAQTLVSIGDLTTNASWTPVSTVLSNPGNVQIRVRATDGPGAGDLVEGGIDSVQVCPSEAPPPPPNCAVNDDFESGAAGWSNSSVSTCTTGAYVRAAPTLVTDGGVTTQVGEDHTPGAGVNAIFTATNSSAGVDDVDGGNCVLQSPAWSVPTTSTLRVWAFHGQRDAGDDPNGDFMLVQVSTDGGASYFTIGSSGDTTSNAAWTPLTTTIPAGSNVLLRVQCSDGPGAGDLVECGIDDLSICPN